MQWAASSFAAQTSGESLYRARSPPIAQQWKDNQTFGSANTRRLNVEYHKKNNRCGGAWDKN